MLYAVAHLPGAFTEGDAPDPATVVALQQRGIIRRRARAGYLELTDDARFSLVWSVSRVSALWPHLNQWDVAVI